MENSTLAGGHVNVANGVSKVLKINREMARRPRRGYEKCMGMEMTPAQREVFLVVDEFWKAWGCSPTLRQIADLRGKRGIGNTKEIVDRLVKLGVLKRLERRRSIRPVYINFRNVE